MIETQPSTSTSPEVEEVVQSVYSDLWSYFDDAILDHEEQGSPEDVLEFLHHRREICEAVMAGDIDHTFVRDVCEFLHVLATSR